MKGEVIYHYAFDVASEIKMGKVQEILESKPFPFEIRTDHTYPKDIPLYKPLAIEPAPLRAPLNGWAVRPLLRVYEVGVVSVAMRVDFEIARLDELLPLHVPVLANGETLDDAAGRLCTDALRSIRAALVQPVPPSKPEAYTVFCLTDVGQNDDVNQWLAANRRAAAGLLTETDAASLSEQQVNEVLRIQCSYTNKDVAVIDWDSALVVDTTGYVDDVVYVLELANLQLEEYRAMDARLDSQLDRAYEDMKASNVRVFSRDKGILHTLRLLKVDVAKLNDEVTHITKFVGDWYLARVYLGARERFHLDHWRSSVEQRLEHLDNLYSVLHGDVFNKRMFWMELLIVIFFILDLLGLFVFKR